MARKNDLDELLGKIRDCRACEGQIPLGPRPVLRASATARLLIVGQAPGTRVHATGIPWNDPSGDRLRNWLGLDRDVFYDESRVAIVPMGFCYPGKGVSGDLPPRTECAAFWRAPLLAQLKRVQTTLLVGSYAQAWHLGEERENSLQKTVQVWRRWFPRFVPMPHPSPRNTLWLKRNPWFEAEVLPVVKQRVAEVLIQIFNRNTINPER